MKVKHLRLLIVDETGQVLENVGEFFSEKALVRWLEENSPTAEGEEDNGNSKST
jgi:hypothetical protein